VTVVAAALAYAATVTFGFVWDDTHLIADSTFVRQPSVVPVLTTQFWQEGEQTDLYRPLVSLSYFLEFRAWGTMPAGYHATNVAAHAAASAMVAWTAWLLFGGTLGAAGAGLVFALHPIHTESVAFISGRPDLFAAALALAALAAHIRRRREVPVAGPLLLGLALFCKETALTVPAALVAYELTLGRSAFDRVASTGQRVVRLWPYAGVTGLVLAARWLVLGTPLGRATDATPPSTRAAMTADAAADYLRWLVFPWPPAPHRLVGTEAAVIGGLLVGVIALATVLAWRRSRVPAFLCCWFALTLAPTLPLVLGRAPQVAERFLYIPSIAFAWLCGWGLATARDRLRARPRALQLGAAAVALAVGVGALTVTMARAADWQDELHLFTRMTRSEPRSSVGHVNLGYVHDRAGDSRRAAEEFRAALALRPDSGPALLGLALTESRRGAHAEAIAYAERARAVDGRGEFVHAQLGAIYGMAGQFDDAAASSREAIRRNPRRLRPYLNLAFALADGGHAAEARQALGDAERVAASTMAADTAELRTLMHLRHRLQGRP
jgi:tetratricopeptide (TPR) repeat protein